MEFSALDQERRVSGLGGDLRPEGRDARRGTPQPLAADVGGDAPGGPPGGGCSEACPRLRRQGATGRGWP